jgi:hypothetical protein
LVEDAEKYFFQLSFFYVSNLLIMSFSASFHIDGHPKSQEGFSVTACDFTFFQETDKRGMPTSNVQGGLINVTLQNVNDPDLLHWMLASSMKKSGKITMSSSIADNKSFQTIEFKDGLLTRYNQTFSEESEVLVNLTISAREITVGGATFMNVWVK